VLPISYSFLSHHTHTSFSITHSNVVSCAVYDYYSVNMYIPVVHFHAELPSIHLFALFCLVMSQLDCCSLLKLVLFCWVGSESIGSSCVVGDDRWAGAYGVSADFIALSHCSAEFIPLAAIEVCSILLSKLGSRFDALILLQLATTSSAATKKQLLFAQLCTPAPSSFTHLHPFIL
jgi:hypothetical protein